VSEALAADRVLGGQWPRTFRLALLEKDVLIALGLVEETGVPAPLLHLVGELFRHARGVLGEEADHVEAIRLIERDAGVEIRG
jgi:3-hydroxyisobutyrate dehydrogenase